MGAHTHKSFLENARDVTVDYGLRAASVLFAGGSAYLMMRAGFNPDDAKVLRHVAGPALLFASNIAGFCNNERLQNTLGVAGSVVMTASFAGADDGELMPFNTALWAGGIITGIPGSHLAPAKQRRMEQENLTSIYKDGMVQTAGIQGLGDVALLGAAFVDGATEMLGPYGTWVLAAAIKTTRAVLNAKSRLKPQIK